MDKFLQDATNWFTTIKAPDLKEKVDSAMDKIAKGEPLEDNYKKLFGFILFDYSMHMWPLSFIDAEEVGEKIGVTEEIKYYANDWINHSKKSNIG
jgi:hypothetical protein